MRLPRAIALASSVAVLSTGCHGHRPAKAVSAPPVDAAAAALVPAAVRGQGSLTVALAVSGPPDEFLAPDGRSVEGMDADLATAIGAALGLRVTLRDTPLPTILTGVAAGQFDLGISSISSDAANRRLDDLVTYFSSGEAVFEATDTHVAVTGVSSLCGYSVAVESGTAEAVAAGALVSFCASNKKPADNVLVFQDLQAAEIAVGSGRVQLGLFVSEDAEYAVGQSAGQLVLAGPAFDPVPYGIAVAPGPLANAVLAALKALVAGGRYIHILDKWHLQAGAIATPAILAPLALVAPTTTTTRPARPPVTPKATTTTTPGRP